MLSSSGRDELSTSMPEIELANAIESTAEDGDELAELIGTGAKILPLVVHKLCRETEAPAVQLCELFSAFLVVMSLTKELSIRPKFTSFVCRSSLLSPKIRVPLTKCQKLFMGASFHNLALI